MIEVWVFAIYLLGAGVQLSDEHGSQTECEWARRGVEAAHLTKDGRLVEKTRECVRVK